MRFYRTSQINKINYNFTILLDFRVNYRQFFVPISNVKHKEPTFISSSENSVSQPSDKNVGITHVY